MYKRQDGSWLGQIVPPLGVRQMNQAQTKVTRANQAKGRPAQKRAGAKIDFQSDRAALPYGRRKYEVKAKKTIKKGDFS